MLVGAGQAGRTRCQDTDGTSGVWACTASAAAELRDSPGALKIRQRVAVNVLAAPIVGSVFGKAPDVRLSANDILFVPASVGKAAGIKGIDAAIQIATGLAVWGL